MTRITFGATPLEVTSSGEGFDITLDGKMHHAQLLESSGGRIELRVDGHRMVAYVSAEKNTRWITVGGRTYVLQRTGGARRAAAAHDSSSELVAPMPGQVRTVNVAVGDAVSKGQVLIVLEAMKMEIRLQAPFDGVVASLEARVGQTVEREQALARIEPRQDAVS